MVMVAGVAAVGDGGDVAALHCFQRWWWCVVVVAICVRGRSLFVVVIMGGRCRSWCGQSLSVIACIDGGGKRKRNDKQTLFVVHHK